MKTPTEDWNILDAFAGFKEKYGKFVTWFKHPEDGYEFCVIKFLGSNPEKYTNKWGREQYKVEVAEEDCEKSILSGGVRLFVKIRQFVEKNARDPKGKDVDFTQKWIQIDRIGSGFNTDYSISFSKK